MWPSWGRTAGGRGEDLGSEVPRRGVSGSCAPPTGLVCLSCGPFLQARSGATSFPILCQQESTEGPRRKAQRDTGWTAIRAVPQTGVCRPPTWASLARDARGAGPKQDRSCHPEPTGKVVSGHGKSPAGPRGSPWCSSPSWAATWDVRTFHKAPGLITSDRELGRGWLQLGRSDCGLEDICHLAQSLRQASQGGFPSWPRRAGGSVRVPPSRRIGDISLGGPKVHTEPCGRQLKDSVQLQEEDAGVPPVGGKIFL